MAVNSGGGSKLYISPTAVDIDAVKAMTEANAVTYYEAISDWVEIEEIEDLGTVGDTAEAITFTSIGDQRVRKLKGPRDAGTQSVVVGRDALDEGQIELLTAEGTSLNYAFKMELADARTDDYSNSLLYYSGMVMSKTTNAGNVSNVHRRNFDIGINSAIIEVASEDTSV